MHPPTRDLGSDKLTTGSSAALARVGAVLAVLVGPATGSAAEGSIPTGSSCLQLPAASQAVAKIVLEGAFSARDARKRREYAVCIHLSVESQITVEIEASELSTVGHVQFPDGHQEGAPGGRFFNDTLPAGYYRMLVGQRWPVWKPGTFKLIISVG